jgi:hypothetical protein
MMVSRVVASASEANAGTADSADTATNSATAIRPRRHRQSDALQFVVTSRLSL